MKNSLAAAVIVAAIAAPGTASAIKVYGDAVEIFGALRVSADYIDQDAAGVDSNLNIASNSSNVGVRGVVPIEGTGLSGFYHLEHLLNLDDGNGSWGGRDNYVGLNTPAGRFSVGYISTPYKIMGIIFTNYVTTAADPFAVLGNSSDSGTRLDLRSRNGLQWQKEFSGVDLKLMYSASMAADGQEVDSQDDNDADMWNGSAIWKAPMGLRVGGAFAKYGSWAGTGIEIDAYRLGLAWGSGPLTAEAIFEDIDSDEDPNISRSLWGANVGYNITSSTNIGAQWMHADDSDAGNDEADQLAVVLTHNLSKALQVHALYSTTRNGDNAAYDATSYGHDTVTSTVGGEPQVFSVGMSLTF